jgi:DNA polymerase III epsilon subunit-like protein
MPEPTRIIVFDTETTGFNPEQHEIVQLSYILYNVKTQTIDFSTKQGDDIVSINAPNISKATSKVHGIEKNDTIGKNPIKEHIDQFIGHFEKADMYVAHNIHFDRNVLLAELTRHSGQNPTLSNFLNTFYHNKKEYCR